MVLATHSFPAIAETPWTDMGSEIIARTLGFFTSALAAATFCHVYRRIVPEAEAATTPA